ncbi:ATP-grasp domain-containing protein [Actinoalloteichus caeruleus]|uniref:Biotin carboxylase n=1 Tax=Actinoalloteichus caeruleus DSM 43889 TaxID=1120930 RepID=A0ABT1JDL7_ACTCY|nr:ATP-grasp domain-containing protein [Actinoalloteichus caeruleus]MCP2330582.1 Biotin carboxylase [Actinoalloteichus caeruleus DSM 43889]
MSVEKGRAFALVESNTTGSGRLFASAARARGLRPVVLTADPSRYPYLRRDHIDVRVVRTSEPDEVLAACRTMRDEQGLAGVTSSSEYFIGTATAVAAALSLPSGDPEAIARCRHKHHQRAALTEAGVPVPDFRVATDVDSASLAATDLALPVVVKPSTGSGSVGVRLCRTNSEVARHARALFGTGARTPILVERYVRGPEFSVETFDGNVVAVVGKHVGPHPHFVELGHDVPAPVPPEWAAELRRCALAAGSALGLGWSASHTEIRMSEDGPVIIEVNPRLAGGMIPTLVRHACGVDLVDWVVAKAAALSLPTVDRSASSASIRFLRARTGGVVTSVIGQREAAASQGVESAVVTVAPGDEIQLTRSFRDRLGYVIATTAAGGDSGALADAALAHLRVSVEAGPREPRR